jgi:polysaccharide export outer membrane protein
MVNRQTASQGARAVAAVLILVAGVTAGVAAPQAPEAGQAAAPDLQARAAVAGERFAEREQRYRIQPGDVLAFQFRFTPEFDQTLKVQPDGYVSLSGIDDLKVGGLNVGQVRDAVVRACSQQLRQPVVDVVLKEFSLPAYVVGGEVLSPGRFELKGDVMLSEAIQVAGGFNSNAHLEQVLLFRRSSEGWMESRQIDFKKLIKSGLNEDIRLRPGDMIFIPRSKMGNVKRFMEAARVGLFFSPFGLL